MNPLWVRADEEYDEDVGQYLTQHKKKALNSDDTVARKETMWALQNAPFERVSARRCPSQTALSLWKMARLAPDKFHQIYGKLLVEEPVAKADSDGEADAFDIDEAKRYSVLLTDLKREWQESRSEDL